MADKNITELVAAAKAGDSGAMDSLYIEYSERLRLFVIKQGLPEQDAEDVVSETFVEVIKHIGQLQNDEYFGTWLHKIALRKIGDLKEKTTAPSGSFWIFLTPRTAASQSWAATWRRRSWNTRPPTATPSSSPRTTP